MQSRSKGEREASGRQQLQQYRQRGECRGPGWQRWAWNGGDRIERNVKLTSLTEGLHEGTARGREALRTLGFLAVYLHGQRFLLLGDLILLLNLVRSVGDTGGKRMGETGMGKAPSTCWSCSSYLFTEQLGWFWNSAAWPSSDVLLLDACTSALRSCPGLSLPRTSYCTPESLPLSTPSRALRPIAANCPMAEWGPGWAQAVGWEGEDVSRPGLEAGDFHPSA